MSHRRKFRLSKLSLQKKLVDKIVEECSEIIDESKIIYNSVLHDYKKVCNSCTVYNVLLDIFFIISISISSVFIYLYWYLIRRYIETTLYQTNKW